MNNHSITDTVIHRGPQRFTYFNSLISSADKFKGDKSELNQSKGGIDLDELMELLKTRQSEWYEMLQF